MKDKIKEILDDFKNDVENNLMIEVRGIYYKPLLDYITNLQEKNKGLHTRIKTIKRRRKAQTSKMRKYREEITNKQNSIVDYKSRNEKAIEYINENKHFELDCNKPFRKVSKYEEAYIKREKDLLNILQGEDKDGNDNR